MAINYSNSYSIEEFFSISLDHFIRSLEGAFSFHHADLTHNQIKAWETEFRDLQTNKILDGLSGRVLFEHRIPGLPQFIDVVLLTEGKIFVIEYKAGARKYEKNDIKQVNGYALRLKYFHSQSNDNWIIPILVATDAPDEESAFRRSEDDMVYAPLLCNSHNLRQTILRINEDIIGTPDKDWEDSWEKGIFRSSPTIIDAARNVWKQNNIRGFQIGEAFVDTRLEAENYIVETVVPETRQRKGKSICFVTGVPGAGKTLVGLNVSVRLQDEGASLLSGNGPLVKVLSAALKQDLKKNQYRLNGPVNKAEVSVESIIRGAYQYKEEIFDKRLLYHVGTGCVALKEDAIPSNQHVIIFDEAQRAWNQKKLITPGQAKKKYWQEEQFPFSEPGLLLWDMNQRDWGVFVCLVGGGQEINTGEAGICEWLRSIKDNPDFDDWHIYMPDQFRGDEYDSRSGDEMTLDDYRSYFLSQNRLTVKSSLHLTACMRSNRTENVSKFVQALLDCDVKNARNLYNGFKSKYQIYLTRDIDKAKKVLRERRSMIIDRGYNNGGNDEDIRIGMLMSSNANRLVPLGYRVYKVTEFLDKIPKWFLGADHDVQSSNFLELAMNEFFVQGLELDFAAVIWDADFRYNPKDKKWDYYTFDFNSGTRWRPVDKKEQEIKRFYMMNAYRVLLTRARAGMVIVVPSGSDLGQDGKLEDPTRDPRFYDSTYNFLHSIGLKTII